MVEVGRWNRETKATWGKKEERFGWEVEVVAGGMEGEAVGSVGADRASLLGDNAGSPPGEDASRDTESRL